MPPSLQRLLGEALTSQPRADMEKDYRRKFVEAEKSAPATVIVGMPD